MASGKSLGAVVFVGFLVGAGCGRSKRPPPPKPLPGVAAGISSAKGPGVPTGFSGAITTSIELTDEERAAIERANELSNARSADVQISSTLKEAR